MARGVLDRGDDTCGRFRRSSWRCVELGLLRPDEGSEGGTKGDLAYVRCGSAAEGVEADDAAVMRALDLGGNGSCFRGGKKLTSVESAGRIGSGWIRGGAVGSTADLGSSFTTDICLECELLFLSFLRELRDRSLSFSLPSSLLRECRELGRLWSWPPVSVLDPSAMGCGGTSDELDLTVSRCVRLVTKDWLSVSMSIGSAVLLQLSSPSPASPLDPDEFPLLRSPSVPSKCRPLLPGRSMSSRDRGLVVCLTRSSRGLPLLQGRSDSRRRPLLPGLVSPCDALPCCVRLLELLERVLPEAVPAACCFCWPTASSSALGRNMRLPAFWTSSMAAESPLADWGRDVSGVLAGEGGPDESSWYDDVDEPSDGLLPGWAWGWDPVCIVTALNSPRTRAALGRRAKPSDVCCGLEETDLAVDGARLRAGFAESIDAFADADGLAALEA